MLPKGEAFEACKKHVGHADEITDKPVASLSHIKLCDFIFFLQEVCAHVVSVRAGQLEGGSIDTVGQVSCALVPYKEKKWPRCMPEEGGRGPSEWKVGIPLGRRRSRVRPQVPS